METDAYYHKTIIFRAWKHELKFHTSQELFSSHDIDTGTKFLLRTIIEAGYPPPSKVLDLGCGYGALGLTLKSLRLDSAITLTDRDALAVEYTRQNTALNNLEAETYGSLGYDDVARNDYDLIVSNIPGKAGEPVITYLLQEARFYLAPGGIMAIVVVSPLEEFVNKVITDTPGMEIILKRQRSGHTVFHYRFNDEKTPPKPSLSSFERGIYHRKDVVMRFGVLEYTMQTAYGLPEFDSLSYDTELLLTALKGFKNREINRVIVFNPGQGHVPVALCKYFKPDFITIEDRDLMALRYSQLNLVQNGCPADKIQLFHMPGFDIENQNPAGLIVGVLREVNQEANKLFLDKAAESLIPGGIVVVSGGSTAITRLVTYIESTGNLNIKSREKRRGYSVLTAEKLDRAGKKR